MTNNDPPRTDVYYRGMIPLSYKDKPKFGSAETVLWYKPTIFVGPSNCDIRDEMGRRLSVNIAQFSSFSCSPPLYNFLKQRDGTYRAFCRASRFSPPACAQGNFSPCCGIRPSMEEGCFECRLATMI
uniref:Uncharacterized protein n=1 Tax=Marseillevirus sp. TaxID=2809551 RepID=A0AA96IXS7_9VIRU|nr:hypothetical protein MarFTMF_477 [Marseillevirus sp.]